MQPIRSASVPVLLVTLLCLLPGSSPAADSPATSPAKAPGILGINITGPTPQDIIIDRVFWGFSAQKAGMKKGDRILEIDGRKIADRKELIEAVIHRLAGETIAFKLERDGKPLEIKVTLGTDAMVFGPLGGPWKKGQGPAPAQEKPVAAIKLPDFAAHAALRGVSFIDPRNGWIVGDKGLCLRTTDGGTTWTRLDFGSQANLRTVHFTENGAGWICGDGDPNSPQPRGHVLLNSPMISATLLHTADGGATWNAAWIPTNFQMYAMAAAPGAILLGSFGGDAHADGSTFVLTGDMKLRGGGRAFRGLFAIAMPSENRAIAVGSPVSVGFFPAPTTPLYTSRGCRALFTADGGVTWQPSKGSEGGGSLRGLTLLGPKIAVAVGDKGQIFRSEDAGESWKSVTSPATETLAGVAWDGDKTLLAIGRKGTILASHDEGITWQAIASETQEDLRNISAAGKFFYAVGGQGVAMRIKAE